MRPPAVPRRRLRRGTERLVDRLAGPLDQLVLPLFQNQATGMLAVDADGRIVRANEALRWMLARGTDLSPGAPAMAIFRAPERDAVGAAMRAMLAGGAPPTGLSVRLEAAESDPDRVVDVAATALTEADGSISGLVLHLSDITARRRLEAELAHARKLRTVGELAGGVAHDFNNLLTVIVGAAEAILDRAEADGQTRKDARQIQATAARGAALVRQLLAFGRPQPAQPRAVVVDEAIRDLSAMLHRLLGGRIRQVLDLQALGRMVRVDPTQLDQVLVNLAVNARDAMPAGGTLTLRSLGTTLRQPLSHGRDSIPPGRYVAIEVQDTGIGIPPDLLGRIFDPFFTTRHEQGGSGLGLATAHGIVRQSGGLLTVESTPGQGTGFRIYLPCHDTPEALAPPVQDACLAAAPPGGRAVLLIEDEELVRRLAEQALTRHGWRVLVADSGEAALDMLAAAPMQAAALAAVVVDMVLPGMDGMAVVRAVRTQRPGLPAILMSGYADEALRRDLARDNIAFLPKPYGPKELVARLDRTVQTELLGPEILGMDAGVGDVLR